MVKVRVSILSPLKRANAEHAMKKWRNMRKMEMFLYTRCPQKNHLFTKNKKKQTILCVFVCGCVCASVALCVCVGKRVRVYVGENVNV